MSFFSGNALEHQLELAENAGVLMQEFDYDESTGTSTIRTSQDVEPYLEQNKKLYNADDRGYSNSGEWRRVASIPLVIVQKWRDEGVDIFDKNHAQAIKRKLNDPENVFLRTAPGRL